MSIRSILYSELVPASVRFLSTEARGIIDEVFKSIVIKWITRELIRLLPFLAYPWASAILAWIVSYFIEPIFERAQLVWDITLIHWEIIEQNEEYKKARDELSDIIDRINSGELDIDDPLVKLKEEAYEDRLLDLIVIKRH